MVPEIQHCMTILDRLSETYHVASKDLVRAEFPCYTFPIGDKQVYGFVVDNVSDGEKIFTFAYDSYVTHEHLYLHSNSPYSEWISPALDISVGSGTTIDEMASRIKTNSKLLTGSKSKQIIHQTESLTSELLDELISIKSRQYPNVNSGHELYFLQNQYQGFVTTGRHHDEWIFKLIWFTNGSDYVGTTILSTEDDHLRKSFSPNITGHWFLIKHAIENKGVKVRFSLFYPYKAIFGVNPTMYPAIKYDNLLNINGIKRLYEMEK